MKHIGEKIKALRNGSGMTQERLADCLHVTYQTVSKWETGVTSPDLSLIVPIARLFRVTTDELFDFRESADEQLHAELNRRYDETLLSLETSTRLSVAEEAVSAFPGDMEWLCKYATALFRDAEAHDDDPSSPSKMEKVLRLCRTVLENCEDEKTRAEAIEQIVSCLNRRGEHEQAKRYAEMYPESSRDSDEKDELLLSCMVGDERIVKRQELLFHKARMFLYGLMRNAYDPVVPAVLYAAEEVVKALIPDENYQLFHFELYLISLRKATGLMYAKRPDAAVAELKKARGHATAYDEVSAGKEIRFTALLFDRVKLSFDPEHTYKLSQETTFEHFLKDLEQPVFVPLKTHKDYQELIKMPS